MKTKDNLKNNNNKTKKKNPFWSFLGGDFLLKESVIRWYPFVLIFFVFAIIATQNEAFLAAKYKEFKELDEKYKKLKIEMGFENKITNHSIPPEIMKFIEEQGFVRKDSAFFKVRRHTETSRKID